MTGKLWATSLMYEGRLAAEPKDNRQLIVPLQGPLTVGTYTVTWNVASVDTHRVSGTYSFKVDR